MPEEKETRLVIEWKRLFPWWHIFRAPSMAMDKWKLTLAIAGIVATWLGWALLALLFDPGKPAETVAERKPQVPAADKASPGSEQTEEKPAGTVGKTQMDETAPPAPSLGSKPEIAALAAQELAQRQRQLYLHTITQEWLTWPAHVPRGDPTLPPHRAIAELSPRLADISYWLSQLPAVLEPLARLIRPLTYFLHPWASWKSHLFAGLGVLWTLLVWGCVGGAITRIAAVEFARNDRIDVWESLRFTFARFGSLFGAPIFPIVVVGVVTVVVVVVGTVLMMIPWVGDLVGALTFPLALLAGLFMAMALLVYAGWPLMYPAISAEGGDAFDAISRSASYMYQRPWHYIFYWSVALVYGVIVLFFVVTFTSFFVYLTGWALDLVWRPVWRSSDPDPLRALFIYAPQSYGWRQMLTGEVAAVSEVANKMALVPWVAALILGAWLHLVFLGMLGFAYSLFWSASTIIYFLLRKDVDETDLDEVYFEEEQEDLFPRPITAPEISSRSTSQPEFRVATPSTGSAQESAGESSSLS
ncbi:MAG: hypothetical protein RMI91_08155 [Gemmatales bacterium]|nr:hypothetical protein [Gemmatales bacterium]MDW7994614.1 hypothetical protein [Gemmatales bacterium]